MKMKRLHGGDIYRNHVEIDFSVNVNPLGIPETVETTLYEAVENCSRYPDISAEKLKKAVSGMLTVPKENLLFGNGASELFMAIIHGIKPKKTVIPVPSFYGYEYAAEVTDGEIIYYETKEKNDFCLQEDFLSVLTEDVDVLFLANPNNPTGKLMSREELRDVLSHCLDKEIYVVLDECFIEFCGKECSMLQEIKTFPNLILVRAFTKIFSIPGVRLGYLICSNQMLLDKIGRQLPEWNLSSFAQAAGYECAMQTAFVEKTVTYTQKERQFLENGMKQMGFRVFSGKANFLLIYCEHPLYDRLLEDGILIRDCENFRGLSKGFYRIAVKSRKENETLLKVIGEIKWN
jgi:histidinol-phosphate aminotransferase